MQTLSAQVIAEVRAEMARRGITAVQISERSGENIFRIRRLLDRRTTVSLDDFAMLCAALDLDPIKAMTAARAETATQS